MTAFLYKFSTTQTQQNGALNRMLAEIRTQQAVVARLVEDDY